MVLQVRRAVSGRLRPFCALVVAVATAASACDKAPLLAPGGTVIFLNATSSSVSSTGSVEIIAVLLEQGTTATPDAGSNTTAGTGTPVHNGTLVSFTTTLGRIEPAEARTQNGSVKVRFIGDGRSGAAKILAYSGGARTELTLNVGAAAAERVLVSATPLGSSGGTSTVTATVEDTSGNPLPGVAVQFSTTRGTLSSGTATTNSAGVATVTLSTTGEATVTATVGTKTASATVTLAARSGLTISAPGTITASSPAQFTVTVASGAQVRDVVVNWGDGSSTPLGAITTSATPSHTYGSGGNYTVSATATMADGSTDAPVSTSISVAEFSVQLECTPSANPPCRATANPSTTNVREYRWVVFNSAGVPVQSKTTDGGTTSFQGLPPGTYTVQVTVVPVTGRERTNSTTVTVS